VADKVLRAALPAALLAVLTACGDARETPVAGRATEPARHAGSAAALHSDGIGDLWFGSPDADARRALERLLGPPDSDEVTFCSLAQTEAEARDHTLAWGDLRVGIGEQPDGSLAFDDWAVVGPELPAAVAVPYGLTPGVGSRDDVLAVDGVSVDEDLESQLGPGYYSRGELRWHVDSEDTAATLTSVSVGLEICD
jgi:hypothetical protein